MRILIYIIVVFLIVLKISPQWSLLLGVLIAFMKPLTIPLTTELKKFSSKILQISVVLLGAGLNFHSVLEDGLSGILVTFVSIIMVLVTGALLARLFKVPSPLSHLLTIGTSICGGSAIGAIGPVIGADSFSMGVSLGIIFIINAVSVFLFTFIGHLFNLSDFQFGTWAALAIHDTSAVVAAAQAYSDEALKVATTLKLTRALWIVPLTVLYALIIKKKGIRKITLPWFILFFLMTSLFFTFLAEANFLIPWFKEGAKAGLTATLFFIGLGINREELKKLQWRTLFFGITLWLVTLVGALIYVLNSF